MLDREVRRALIVLAVAVRVAAVVVLQSHLVPRSTYEHGEIAENLVAGKGFSVKFLGAEGPTSQQAPVYPYLLAAAYAVGGVGTPSALLGFELAQCLLGGWLVAEVMSIAGRVMPQTRWAVVIAGLVAAFYPTLVYAATHVQVALLAATLLAATISRAYRTSETGRTRDGVLTGLLLSLLILTDPILGLVFPAVCLAFCLRRGPQQASKLGAVVLGVALLGISPWIVRNALVHREFVFIKSTFGYAFWQGNCSLSEGTDKVVRRTVDERLATQTGSLEAWNRQLWAARHEAGYLDDIALTRADYEMLSRESEPERSRILLRRSLADLEQEPGRYASLCLRRLRYFFLFDETNPKTRNAIYRISHLGLSAMALMGLLIVPGTVRKQMMPLVLTVGLIALFHSLTIVSARFHIPIEPILAILSGGVLARGIRSAAPADDVIGIGVEDSLRGRFSIARGRSGVPKRHVLSGQKATAQNT